MDVLSEVLTTVHLTSEIFCRADLTAPWGISTPEVEHAPFYVVVRGSCYLEVPGRSMPMAVTGGEVILLPHGSAHVLRDSPGGGSVALHELAQHGDCRETHRAITHGGGGAKTTIIGGAFRFLNQSSYFFLRAMPPLLHFSAEAGNVVPWLESTLKCIAAETNSSGPGARVMVERLSDMLFIQLVRGSVLRQAELGHDCSGNIFRALTDPQIAPAVEAMHRQPEKSWTVASLAEQANMSRTAFSNRFTSLAGTAPLAYLTRWRMMKASDLLHQGSTLAEVAERVGYESEAAFSKAFKREMGIAPGMYRQQRL